MSFPRILFLPLLVLLLHGTTSAQDFRVQIAAFESPKPDAYFKDQGIVNFFSSTDQMGIYRYFAGTYPTRDEAEKALLKVREKGFPNAYVVDLEEQRILCWRNCPFIRNGVIFVKDTAEAKTTRKIYFDSGVSTLSAESKMTLDEMVQMLKANPKSNLDVKGYTDGIGEATTNIELAAARARAARNYLIAKGIRADRMFIKVYGEADPAALNKSEEDADLPENRIYNRRVVLSLTDEKE